MEKDKVEKALVSLDDGLIKYIRLMDWFYQVDVSKDADFQRAYNHFYRMRQRKPEFYQDYYEFMQSNKNRAITFSDILLHFYNKFDRVEASFSSKMLATLNPDKPIWDEFVLQNLKIKKPAQYSKDRVKQTIEIYSKIESWYEDFLKSEIAKDMLMLFDERYPNIEITNVKKIDLILWQTR